LSEPLANITAPPVVWKNTNISKTKHTTEKKSIPFGETCYTAVSDWVRTSKLAMSQYNGHEQVIRHTYDGHQASVFVFVIKFVVHVE